MFKFISGAMYLMTSKLGGYDGKGHDCDLKNEVNKITV